MPYRKLVFVCVNQRPEESPKRSCGRNGAQALLTALQAACRELGLADVKVVMSGCLGPCEQGNTAVVFPDNVWYGHLEAADAYRIAAEHLARGRPLEERRMCGVLEDPGASG